MDSIWTQTAELPRFPPLERDLRTDILIVGGGMAGLLCAYLLDRAGADYALVEADRICGGVTGGTTAKITSQHGLIYHKLIRRLGPREAKLYLEANQAALERYRELCRNIDCDFEEKDAFVYAADDREKIRQELAALKSLGFAADFAPELPLPVPAAGAVRFPRQAQFHPLKFAAAVARGLRIYEHTRVLELMPGGALTTGGRVAAKRTVIATHFPILNKHGAFFLKMYQQRSYVLALKNAPVLPGMYLEDRPGGYSFRGYNGLLLLGGAGGRTGKKHGGWKELEALAARYYPGAEITARWAAQDCMTLDGVPYVGRYGGGTRGLYVATGFGKWGMTSAMAAAMVLGDLLQGRNSPYAHLFDPARSILRLQLAANILESTLGLLTPTVPRCPHMGCALRYNPAEHSWDCPCHGSRFDEKGRLLDNPATAGKRL